MYFEEIADHQYAIRIARGEDVFTALTSFCNQEGIKGAFFTGIGAVGQLELAHYSVENKKYSKKSFTQPLEVTQLTGNIAYTDEDIVIHAHGTFSDPDMHCIGGHIVNCQVSGTLEILLTETNPLNKSADVDTGLKILNLDNQL